jgi:hypothetical protein
VGLQDRDYMRRRTHDPRPPLGSSAQPRVKRGAKWPTWLLVAGAVVAVAGAAVWLLRDIRPVALARDSAPREGSLVVNVNSASQQQLETVPGIGPALASLIIAGRPYQSVDDLLRVSGIGERNLESMRPFFKTDGETQRR